jgi:hypothetical protein
MGDGSVIPEIISGRRIYMRMQDEGIYCCPACGEEIVVPIDLSAGAVQEYDEDCPVCCHPNTVHVAIEEDGNVRVWVDEDLTQGIDDAQDGDEG